MKKKIFLAILSLSFFITCKKELRPVDERLSGDGATQNAAALTHPNIILIVGDDVGYEIPTCNGGQSYQTPNLDNLAARGRRYIQCHGSPMCSPSRFALLTGKYNFRNYTRWGKMDLSNKTIGNMFRDAGYATCYAGKWQLDGYDASIRGLGWKKYCVWQPGPGSIAGSRYKNPQIYQNGNFLPDSATLNKYADDMFLDYITSFTDTVSKPYFVYYSMSLVHTPYCPTPDDPEFASWDPNNPGDTRFFPSMVKYMDKKIGELLSRISPNTIVIYVGDNGTEPYIYSLFNGILVRGGKTTTTVYGTHVPLILYKPGKAPKIDSSLIDFTDFLPTLASIANIPLPTTYGMLDGVCFFPKPSTRQSIYFHYCPYPEKNSDLSIWVQNSDYKRYDTTVRAKEIAKRDQLFNNRLDPQGQHPILPGYQTTGEKFIDSTFKSIIHFYALQQ